MTQDEIDDLTAEWDLITGVIDFQNGKWYERDVGSGEGVWREVAFFRVHDLLGEFGFGESERDTIIKQLIWRDKEATKRRHVDSKRIGMPRGKVKRSAAEKRLQRKAQQELEL
jgi:hypothetical protein